MSYQIELSPIALKGIQKLKTLSVIMKIDISEINSYTQQNTNKLKT